MNEQSMVVTSGWTLQRDTFGKLILTNAQGDRKSTRLNSSH